MVCKGRVGRFVVFEFVKTLVAVVGQQGETSAAQRRENQGFDHGAVGAVGGSMRSEYLLRKGGDV